MIEYDLFLPSITWYLTTREKCRTR